MASRNARRVMSSPPRDLHLRLVAWNILNRGSQIPLVSDVLKKKKKIGIIDNPKNSGSSFGGHHGSTTLRINCVVYIRYWAHQWILLCRPDETPGQVEQAE